MEINLQLYWVGKRLDSEVIKNKINKSDDIKYNLHRN